MLGLIAILIVVGFVLYCILWPETEREDYRMQKHFLVLLIKIIYKGFRFTQGVLKIGSELVYRAGPAGAGANCSLRILPTNHTAVVTGIRVDKHHLQQYREVCGYDPADSQIPICYPESLFLKQISAVITSKKFCLSPIGLIHLRQTIKQHESLEEYINAELQGTTTVSEYRETNRGVEVDIKLSLSSPTNMCIWEGCLTLLSRSKVIRSRETRRYGEREEGDKFSDVNEVYVPEDTGRKFAKITGDWNPHHLYKYSAWLLGYKAPIAHGMWTLSRILTIRRLFGRYPVYTYYSGVGYVSKTRRKNISLYN